MMRLAPLAILLVACQPTPPSPQAGPPVCLETTQEIASDLLLAAWTSASGSVFAIGPSGLSVRGSDGVWVDEEVPGTPTAIDGIGDEAWIITTEGVYRREPGGSWVSTGLLEAGSLTVRSPEDVMVVSRRVDGMSDSSLLTLHHWDGATWSSSNHALDGAMTGAKFLPDGRLVAASTYALRVLEGDTWVEIPTDLPRMDGLISGPDGTLVTLGPFVGMGGVDGVFATNIGAPEAYSWQSGLVVADDDIWLLGYTLAAGDIDRYVVTHWDGSEWSEVPMGGEFPRLYAIRALDTERVVVVGGSVGATVLVGSSEGLSAEVDTPGVNGIYTLGFDDVTGLAWGLGFDSAAVSDGGPWRPQTMPGLEISYRRPFAVTDGRLLLTDRGELTVFEDGGVTVEHGLPAEGLFATCGAGGTLFAMGAIEAQNGTGSMAYRPAGYRNGGAGWAPLDLSGLPESSSILSCWADSPDDLWVGLSTDPNPRNGGALAHWDGSQFRVVDPGLLRTPEWMARQVDGKLWMSLSAGPDGTDPLWVFDGETTELVADTPNDIRAVHLLPDGTLYASVVERPPVGGLELGLHRRSPDGSWEVQAVSEQVVPLVGSGEQVWAAMDGDLAWRRSCR